MSSYESMDITIHVCLDAQRQECVTEILNFYHNYVNKDGDHPFSDYTRADAIREALEFGIYNKITEYRDCIRHIENPEGIK